MKEMAEDGSWGMVVEEGPLGMELVAVVDFQYLDWDEDVELGRQQGETEVKAGVFRVPARGRSS